MQDLRAKLDGYKQKDENFLLYGASSSVGAYLADNDGKFIFGSKNFRCMWGSYIALEILLSTDTIEQIRFEALSLISSEIIPYFKANLKVYSELSDKNWFFHVAQKLESIGFYDFGLYTKYLSLKSEMNLPTELTTQSQL